MNYEADSSSENHEQDLKHIDRFDRLLGRMNGEGETGWLELPSKWVKDPATGKGVHVQFWVYNPKPLNSGYEAASYSPSIMLEIGKREYDDDGSLSKKVNQLSVKRVHLERGDSRDKAFSQDSEKILERLEYVYGIYEETT
jgi:hypothetical protein